MPRAKTPRNGMSKPQAALSEDILSLGSNTNGDHFDLESEIRRRAYELYEERGRMPGHEDEDWAVAEREVTARYGLQTV